jgi:23S rRNA (adenine2503-C2)-methyltransferase
MADSPFTGVDLLSLPRERLLELVSGAGLPAFRATQLFRWLHGRGERDPSAMSDLPLTLRHAITAAGPLPSLTLHADHVSHDGSRKLVLHTAQGHAIESVWMPMAAGVTQCLSSQVGCKMGCDFCATARMPVRADLSAGAIVEQVALATRLAWQRGEVRGGVGAVNSDGPLAARPHNLVFMGMGEPLDNLDAVIDALAILTDPEGYGFSPRRITVSTSGLAKYLPRLAAAQPAVHLAWSLTATTDAVRDRLMPVNKGVPIRKMVDVLLALPANPHRKITFEYALLDGTNASLDDARRLAEMAREVGAHVNVIPFNAWPGAPYRRPPRAAIRAFIGALVAEGASVSLRESKGQDIGAACGQLAATA